MKWIAISGTWKLTSSQIEADVRKAIREIFESGDGIVTGGALNVDSFATDEAIGLDPKCKRIKIFLPTTLGIYSKHYRKRAGEGVITVKQAEDLIDLLEKVKKANPNAIIENKVNKVVNQDTYFERNTRVIEAADKLIIFHVIESTGGGTTDSELKAKEMGILVERHDYKLS
jgi:hypothetical protein